MGVSESNINILQTDFEQKKLLQRNTSHTMALYVSEKHSVTRGFGQKKLPPPPLKSQMVRCPYYYYFCWLE